MVISLSFSLEIPVIINTLYEMIKFRHEKMLNGIYLWQLHNDTSEENNSLNGYSNELWVNG